MDLAKEVQDAQALMQYDPEAALSALESLYGKATASLLKERKDRVYRTPPSYITSSTVDNKNQFKIILTPDT